MMCKFKELSIRNKVAAVGMTICTVALLCGSLIQIARERHQVRTNMVRDMELSTQAMGHTCAPSLVFQDAEAATEAMRGYALHTNVQYAALYDANGAAFANYRAPGLADIIPKTAPTLGDAQFSASGFQILVPVTVDHEPVGLILVQSDLSILEERMAETWRTLGLTLLITMALAFAVSHMLRRLIAKPNRANEIHQALSQHLPRTTGTAVAAKPSIDQAKESAALNKLTDRLHAQPTVLPRSTDPECETDVPALDVELALEALEGNVELYESVLEMFMEELPGLLNGLEMAAKSGSLDELRDAAHSLKGAAASIGAIPISSAASHLEQLGAARDFDGLDTLILEMRNHILRLEGAVDAHQRFGS